MLLSLVLVWCGACWLARADEEESSVGTFDFVIVGAGSGGSVLANRLSEVASFKVLLLEAGKEEMFLTDIPLLAPLMHITDYNWNYRTEPKSGEALKVAESRSFAGFNTSLLPVAFPGCEAIGFASDDYWRCVARHVSTTLGHFTGTCRMGPRAEGGVVDERLRVHGINGLRVVDASVMPEIVAGHTCAPAYMIGEKAADMIKRDWAVL